MNEVFFLYFVWLRITDEGSISGSRDLFVPQCDSFPMNREKEDTHSLKKLLFQYIHVFTLVLHAAG